MKMNGGKLPDSGLLKEANLDNYESSMSWLKNSQIRFFDTKFMDSIVKQEHIVS